MKNVYSVALTLLLLFALTQTSLAANSWQLDKAHSSVSFRVNHILAKVIGVFDDYTAEVTFDPDNPTESSFYIEIKASSINTNISKRDKHLTSGDFFDASKFPTITFQSTSVTDEGNGSYAVAGNLNVKGKAYPLTIPLQYLGVANHPMKKGSQVIGFNIDTSLDRLLYGIGNGSFYQKGVVGKEVDVFVSLEMLSK